jgi:hypothetical protein
LLQILKDGLKKRWETSQHALAVRANAKSKNKKVDQSTTQPLEKVPLRKCPIVHLYIREQHQGEKEVLKIEKFSDFAEFHFLGDTLVARPKRQRPPVIGRVATTTWATTEDRFGRIFNKTNEKIGFNATNMPERPNNEEEEDEEEGDDGGQSNSLSNENTSTNQSNPTPVSASAETTSTTSSSQASGSNKKRANSSTENAPSKKAKTNAAKKNQKPKAAPKKKKDTKQKSKTPSAKKAPAPKKAATGTGKRSADTMLSPTADTHEAVTTASSNPQSNMEPSTTITSSTPDSSSKRVRTLPSSLISNQTSLSAPKKQTKSIESSEKVDKSFNNDTQNGTEMEASLGLFTLSFVSNAVLSRPTEISESNTKKSSKNKRTSSTAFNLETIRGLEGKESAPTKKSKVQHTETFKKQKRNQNADGEGDGRDSDDDSRVALDSEMTDVEDDIVEMEWEL